MSSEPRLDLGSFEVREVVFGPRTALEGHTLIIEREAVRRQALQDARLADVEVLLAQPGEALRLVHVMDVVEPRCKLGGGSAFPGFLGPPRTAGEGTTNRLDGVAVVEVGEALAGEPTWWREAIVDMSGPGAALSPFGRTHNVVLKVQAREGLAYGDGNVAARLAGLRVAEYLAGVTRELAPHRSETLTLGGAGADLPRVVYVYQFYTPYLYGHIDQDSLATLLHPNEILDGAVVNSRNGPASTRPVTYLDQNNAVIQELYAGHGRDWAFAGVVAYAGHDAQLDHKERGAGHAAKLVRMLGAEGAILTYLSSGHPTVNIMLVCQECERMGIKTVLLMQEMAATPEDSGFVHCVPEAAAVVNTGNFEERLRLPAMPLVIGGTHLFEEGLPAGGELDVTVRHILGATSQFGCGTLRAVRY